MLRIFIGYDSKEIVAYHTCVQSIIDHATQPVAITPVCLTHMTEYRKPRHSTQSTEFSMSRFMVPYLCDYQGTAIFVDCDTIFRADPAELMMFAHEGSYPQKAVYVVKHDYTPNSKVKFLDQIQTTYEKKNWSSVVVFNNWKCKKLTPKYINKAGGLELHQFKWLDSDDDIGALPVEWNHLVGEYLEDPTANLVHFTQGTPCFSGWENQEHSDEWFDVMKRAMSSKESTIKLITREIKSDPALQYGGEW